MKSFGGVPIDCSDLDIDFLISSPNKCLQSVPGFSYVIAKVSELEKCKSNARSVSFDLYEQWCHLEKSNGFRFTSPTHTIVAFNQALKEFDEELEATYIDCTGHDKATLCRDVKKQSHHQEEIE